MSGQGARSGKADALRPQGLPVAPSEPYIANCLFAAEVVPWNKRYP